MDRIEAEIANLIVDAPQELEACRHGREARGRAAQEILAELQGQGQVDIRVGHERELRPQLTQLGEAKPVAVVEGRVGIRVGRALLDEIDFECGSQVRIGAVVVVVDRIELQQGELAGQFLRQPDVETDLKLLAVLRRQVHVEAVDEVEPEAEVEAPVQVDHEVLVRLEREARDAEVDADAAEIDDLAQGEVPLDEGLFLGAGIGDVGVEPDDAAEVPGEGVGVDGLAVRIEQQAGGRQEIEEQAGDDVLVRIVEGLDGIAEGIDEALAEVLDKAGALREGIADQRQLEAEDLAGQQVLKAFEHEIDAVDRQQDAVEEADVVEVELEVEVRGIDRGKLEAPAGQEVGEVARDDDLARGGVLRREEHRQDRVDALGDDGNARRTGFRGQLVAAGQREDAVGHRHHPVDLVARRIVGARAGNLDRLAGFEAVFDPAPLVSGDGVGVAVVGEVERQVRALVGELIGQLRAGQADLEVVGEVEILDQLAFVRALAEGRAAEAGARLEAGVDARAAALDEDPERPERRDELDGIGGGCQLADQAGAVEDVELAGIVEVDAEIEVEGERALRQQVGGARKVAEIGIHQVEVQRQHLADRLLEAERDLQQVAVVVADEGEVQVLRIESEDVLKRALEELQAAGGVRGQGVDVLGEAVGQRQQVVDALVDHRDRRVEEIEAFELAQEVRQGAQAVDDVGEAQVLEAQQVVEVREDRVDLRQLRIDGEGIAEVHDVDQHLRRGAQRQALDRGADADPEGQVADVAGHRNPGDGRRRAQRVALGQGQDAIGHRRDPVAAVIGAGVGDRDDLPGAEAVVQPAPLRASDRVGVAGVGEIEGQGRPAGRRVGQDRAAQVGAVDDPRSGDRDSGHAGLRGELLSAGQGQGVRGHGHDPVELAIGRVVGGRAGDLDRLAGGEAVVDPAALVPGDGVGIAVVGEAERQVRALVRELIGQDRQVADQAVEELRQGDAVGGRRRVDQPDREGAGQRAAAAQHDLDEAEAADDVDGAVQSQGRVELDIVQEEAVGQGGAADGSAFDHPVAVVGVDDAVLVAVGIGIGAQQSERQRGRRAVHGLHLEDRVAGRVVGEREAEAVGDRHRDPVRALQLDGGDDVAQGRVGTQSVEADRGGLAVLGLDDEIGPVRGLRYIEAELVLRDRVGGGQREARDRGALLGGQDDAQAVRDGLQPVAQQDRVARGFLADLDGGQRRVDVGSEVEDAPVVLGRGDEERGAVELGGHLHVEGPDAVKRDLEVGVARKPHHRAAGDGDLDRLAVGRRGAARDRSRLELDARKQGEGGPVGRDRADDEDAAVVGLAVAVEVDVLVDQRDLLADPEAVAGRAAVPAARVARDLGELVFDVVRGRIVDQGEGQAGVSGQRRRGRVGRAQRELRLDDVADLVDAVQVDDLGATGDQLAGIAIAEVDPEDQVEPGRAAQRQCRTVAGRDLAERPEVEAEVDRNLDRDQVARQDVDLVGQALRARIVGRVASRKADLRQLGEQLLRRREGRRAGIVDELLHVVGDGNIVGRGRGRQVDRDLLGRRTVAGDREGQRKIGRQLAAGRRQAGRDQRPHAIVDRDRLAAVEAERGRPRQRQAGDVGILDDEADLLALALGGQDAGQAGGRQGVVEIGDQPSLAIAGVVQQQRVCEGVGKVEKAAQGGVGEGDLQV